MKKNSPYRKFQSQKDRIAVLEKTNPRFKRVYDEYEVLSEELWKLETTEGTSIPDDFINSFKIQTTFLEDEIKSWLVERAG
ncbi:hypothetical protein H1R16_05490 [Marnyiella aurantia]|uniref:DUF465 domain-containing protein n=1 Tax=Marnyiella aurantia TaxID=2758037 RepID=A0A7D7LUS3_9FLAO|nr:hypothetical protein [Marnyiella aurantia]MBA5247829.1 hypothetical protein [Marnyiella aurantia]MBP0613519.1 hypothetical protein [Marnyiella aurantia]QMS99455.1 hypothetical protein H1R16_05490 [Marnyiella aurantia]